jgi:hypothetical protein
VPVDIGHGLKDKGKAFLGHVGRVADVETNLRRERQLNWIMAATWRGVYKGT